MEKRPKIKIRLEPVDIIWEMLGILGLVLLFAFPIIYYSHLPDTIPIHFDLKGNADGYGSKVTVWLLPIIGLFTYVMMFVINLYPHTFNYLVPITPENAPRQYQIACRMIRVLNTVIVLGFTYFVYAFIQDALGKTNGLSLWFIAAYIIAIFAVIIWALYRSKRDV